MKNNHWEHILCAIALLILTGCGNASSKQTSPAAIQGAAWLNKKPGNSEVLRGLNVYLLNTKVSNKHRINVLQVRLERATKELSISKRELIKTKADIQSFSKRSLSYDPKMRKLEQTMRKATHELKVALEDTIAICTDSIPKLENELSVAKNKPNSTTVDLKEIYELLPQPLPVSYISLWSEIFAEQLVENTYTDIDGRYEFKTANGSYYLYANSDNDYYVIEWLIPISVNRKTTTKMDLQNSNASFIINK